MRTATVFEHRFSVERALIFHDFTLGAGRQISTRQHDSRQLVRGAVEIFRTLLERHEPHGGDFRAPLPHKDFARFELDWRSSTRGAALADFWIASGEGAGRRCERVSTSALVSGQNASDDRLVLDTLQAWSLRGFAGTPIEPGFEGLTIVERPAIVTVVWPNPNVADRDFRLVADMETCLAAAFFESTQVD